MIVISAGAEVRAREPHVGEAGAVGAAADRNDLRLDAAGCHRLFGDIDQVHARLGSVVITRPYLEKKGGPRIEMRG